MLGSTTDLHKVNENAQENGDKTRRDSILETDEAYKERWRSIWIIYFTVFLNSLGFSIGLTGVAPYMDTLDKTVGRKYLGYVVAANPFGQTLLSPVAGWWANYLGSVTQPLVVSMVIFVVASGMYGVLELLTTGRIFWMFVSRLLIGFSSANMAVCRSYSSSATKVSERTNVLAKVSLAQALGFIVGPPIQGLLTPLGEEGYTIAGLPLNMYTGPAWVSVLLGLTNLVLFHPSLFTERPIAGREAMKLSGSTSEKAAWKGAKPDLLSAWSLIVTFFNLNFLFVLLETLGTVLIADQFAFTHQEALEFISIAMGIGGVIACGTFVFLGKLSKMMGEVEVLIWGGFFSLFLGSLVFYPWSGDPPIMAPALLNGTSTVEVGCPATQTWCEDTPAMTKTQFYIGYLLFSVGYPIGIALIQTVFSKIIGPRPQGVWMGFLTCSGSFARVMGPVMVNVVYTAYGTKWTFGGTTAVIVITTVWLRIIQNRVKSSVESISSKILSRKPDPAEVELVQVEKVAEKA